MIPSFNHSTKEMVDASIEVEKFREQMKYADVLIDALEFAHRTVKCKDCAYGTRHTNEPAIYNCDVFNAEMDSYDFCSYGKKKGKNNC